MFECQFAPRAVTVSRVISARDGWHGVPSLRHQAAAIVGLDPITLSADEALSALVALQEHRARLDAVEVDLLVRSAGATRVVRDVLVEADDAGAPGDVVGEPSAKRRGRVVRLVDEVVDEIACVLHRPHGQMQSEVRHARLLAGPLARTREVLGAGRITLGHASAIAQQANRLGATPSTADPDVDEDAARVLASRCGRLQDRVLPYANHETVAQTRTRARRAVAAIDKAGEAERRRRAKAGCDVTGYGIDDGLAVIEARLPLADAARILASVDHLARALAADGTTGDPAWLERHGLEPDATLGQLRAAAFIGLFGGGSATGVGVEVQVLIDAATLAGLDPDGAAWIQVGTGPAEAMGRDDLLRLLADPGTHATIRRLVTDPATGALVDRGAHRYPITASLTAWITARDVTCRFPGCTRRAARCDIDHAVDFADGGQTTIANTGALCRRHHNRKTHAGWRITDSAADGSCVFTSPAGYEYHHQPIALIPPPEPPPPAKAVPTDDSPPF